MTTKPNLTLVSLIATVGLSTLAVGSVSQAQVPPRPNAPAATRPAPPTRAEIEQRMAQRRAERVSDIATVLRLTPAQRPLLDALVASRTPPARDAAARPDPQARRNMTTQQRIDEQTKRQAERTAAGAKRTEALSRFYAALSPEQKQAFDALNRLRGGDGRGRGGDHFGGPRGRDGGKGMHGPGGPGRGGDRDGRRGPDGPRGPGGPPPPPPAR